MFEFLFRRKPAYRRVFIADTHVGHPLAKSAALLSFLESCTTSELYLVGDIFDDLVQTLHPQQVDQQAMEKLRESLTMLASQHMVVQLAGNHDLATQPPAGVVLAGEPYHLDDTTLLVHGHGEEWLWRVGHFMLDPVRQKLKGRIPVRKAFKGGRLRNRVVTTSGFYLRLAALAKKHQATTIIHGHVHMPGIRQRKNGLKLICLPDWLDNAGGALVEFADGRRALVDAQHQVTEWAE